LSSQDSTSGRPETFIGRHPVTAYFALTFAVSWMGALAVAALHLKQGEPLPKMTGILMFPAMLLGPSLVGIALTERLDGRRGLRALLARMLLGRLPARWYAALLIAPVLILIVLFCLKAFVSPAYAPNRFLVGVLFGVPAGFLEEIGWTGYAFRKMRSQYDALPASILLGLLWSMWHLPVIDYLGTATPHAGYWFSFFLAFTAAMTAMRVLISWIYTNTNSVLLAQLMHVSSTASLVIFSPPRVTAAQEAMWYALYGTSLWLTVAVIAKTYGICLTRQSH
jgi:uncharacterized protein